MSKSKQAGFTILELTIATAIFSIILLVITTGILQFSKSYMSGIYRTRTQETTRTIMSNLTESVQFASSVDSEGPEDGWEVYCFDNVRYSFRENQRFQVNDPGSHALVRSPIVGGVCDIDKVFDTGDVELLGNNMRLHKLDISGTGKRVTINLHVLYGEDDIINLTEGRCISGAGSQFCASSALTSTVNSRL